MQEWTCDLIIYENVLTYFHSSPLLTMGWLKTTVTLVLLPYLSFASWTSTRSCSELDQICNSDLKNIWECHAGFDKGAACWVKNTKFIFDGVLNVTKSGKKCVEGSSCKHYPTTDSNLDPNGPYCVIGISKSEYCFRECPPNYQNLYYGYLQTRCLTVMPPGAHIDKPSQQPIINGIKYESTCTDSDQNWECRTTDGYGTLCYWIDSSGKIDFSRPKSVTKAGKKCIPWNMVQCHFNDKQHIKHNYCINEAEGAWCYVSSDCLKNANSEQCFPPLSCQKHKPQWPPEIERLRNVSGCKDREQKRWDCWKTRQDGTLCYLAQDNGQHAFSAPRSQGMSGRECIQWNMASCNKNPNMKYNHNYCINKKQFCFVSNNCNISNWEYCFPDPTCKPHITSSTKKAAEWKTTTFTTTETVITSTAKATVTIISTASTKTATITTTTSCTTTVTTMRSTATTSTMMTTTTVATTAVTSTKTVSMTATTTTSSTTAAKTTATSTTTSSTTVTMTTTTITTSTTMTTTTSTTTTSTIMITTTSTTTTSAMTTTTTTSSRTVATTTTTSTTTTRTMTTTTSTSTMMTTTITYTTTSSTTVATTTTTSTTITSMMTTTTSTSTMMTATITSTSTMMTTTITYTTTVATTTTTSTTITSMMTTTTATTSTITMTTTTITSTTTTCTMMTTTTTFTITAIVNTTISIAMTSTTTPTWTITTVTTNVTTVKSATTHTTMTTTSFTEIPISTTSFVATTENTSPSISIDNKIVRAETTTTNFIVTKSAVTLTTTTMTTSKSRAKRFMEKAKKIHKVVARHAQQLGCVAIICSCSSILAIFLFLREFSNERCLHMSQELCLLLIHILVALCSNNYEIKFLCTTTSILEQFSMIGLFMFLIFESLHSYSILTNVIRRGAWHQRLTYQIISLGAAAVCVLVAAIINLGSLTATRSCWVNYERTLVWIFTVFPISAACCATAVFTEATGIDMRKPIFGFNTDQRKAAILNSLAMITLLPLHVASFAFTSAAVYHLEMNENLYPFMADVCCVTNTLLAVKLFVFHCLSNPAAKVLVKRLWLKLSKFVSRFWSKARLCRKRNVVETGPRYIYYP